MNKQESLELYAQGREAWNKWAEARLAERKELEDADLWLIDHEKTRQWDDRSRSDFRGHHFTEDANFENFIFPGDTDFSRSDIAVGAVAFPQRLSFRARLTLTSANSMERRIFRILSLRAVHFSSALSSMITVCS